MPNVSGMQGYTIWADGTTGGHHRPLRQITTLLCVGADARCCLGDCSILDRPFANVRNVTFSTLMRCSMVEAGNGRGWPITTPPLCTAMAAITSCGHPGTILAPTHPSQLVGSRRSTRCGGSRHLTCRPSQAVIAWRTRQLYLQEQKVNLRLPRGQICRDCRLRNLTVN